MQPLKWNQHLIIILFIPLGFSENISMLNYCAIQEVLCDGRSHIACFSQNNLRRPGVADKIDIPGGALLRKINTVRSFHHLPPLAWNKELVELSQWINVYNKNDCLTSSKFVDIKYTELQVYKKFFVLDYDVRNLPKSPLIEVVGCVQVKKTKRFYTLKCLYNASNKSTPEEYKRRTLKRTKTEQFQINLKLYDIWLLYGLIILVWSGVLIIPIFRYVVIRFARIKLTQGMR